uniref:Uncharacterized protein n=1 Tax=Arundo donax TaxID=35708 RepID=A0A0A9A3R2_ARUDO
MNLLFSQSTRKRCMNRCIYLNWWRESALVYLRNKMNLMLSHSTRKRPICRCICLNCMRELTLHLISKCICLNV